MNKYDKLVKDLKHQIDYIGDESFDFEYFQNTLDSLKELHSNDRYYNNIIEEILEKYWFIDLDEISMNLKVWCRPMNPRHHSDGYYYLFIKTVRPDDFEIVHVENPDEWNKSDAFHKMEEYGIIFDFNNPIEFENIIKCINND